MKRASLVLYLAILLVSLGLAYLTWVEEPKKPGASVPVLRCKKGDILELTYAAGDRTVTFSMKKSRYSGEPFWWVEAKEEAKGIEVFRANQKLQDEVDKFCPWKAIRSLGKPEGEKREEFGLVESAESLMIERASGRSTFRLGGETFGPQDRYIADDETGEVFLVAGKSLRDLLRPKSRFMERSLHAFTAKDVARIKLRAGAREKELVHRVSEEGGEKGWADGRAPEETKELYGNWTRRLFALRPTDYVRPPDGEEREGCIAPTGSEQELSLTFYSPNREIGFLTLYEETDEKGGSTYYACSEYTEVVVKVPKTQAETLLKDMEDVLSD